MFGNDTGNFTSIETMINNIDPKQDLFHWVEVEINTSCNRRCSQCPNSIFDRGLIQNEKLMPTWLFHKIIDELAEIDFSGRISPHFYGEPLLDKRLVDFMRYAKKRLPKVTIIIFTNGDYLTFDKYMELVNAGVDEFHVTQHSLTMPDGIKDLLRHFKSLIGLPVPIQYFILNDMSPLYNRGGLISVLNNYDIPNCALRNFRNVFIDYEGNVVLCCNDYFSSIRFGNLKGKKLLDIWFDEKFKKVRRDLRAMYFNFPLCKRCTENMDLTHMRKAFTKMKLDSQEVPDEETFLHDPIDTKNLVEIPETTDFWVETIRSDKIGYKSEAVFIIGGWAVDSVGGSPAAAIFIKFDTGQEFRAYYPISREDIATHFRNDSLRDSGFMSFIPFDKLPPGRREFRLKIITLDRAGFYYPSKRFSLNIDTGQRIDCN